MSRILQWAVPIAFLMHGLGMLGGVYFIFTKASWLTRAEGAVARARLVATRETR